MVKIIKNGRVIDPESRFDGRADLWIENGKIQKIVKKDTKAESDGASDAPSIPADAGTGGGILTLRGVAGIRSRQWGTLGA
jgi:formylmethanofuran dehydrogenase subunit A